MAFRLGDRELELLQGLPHFVRSLYLFGVRPYMDYRTGLVGVVRGISWQSIAEALYVEPRQGETDSGTPDKSRVRRAAARLEAAGLIVNQSQEKRLIFFCCAADTDQSVANKPDTNPTQTRHSEADTAKPSAGAGYAEEADTSPAYPQEAKADTPPVSGIRKRHTSSPKGDSVGARAALDLSVLPTDLSPAVWQDWLRHRRAKRSPVSTQTVVNQIAAELEKARALGWLPDAALAEAMAAGWTGVKATWLQNRAASSAGPVKGQGAKRRGGFSEIDYEGEARAMGFREVI